MPRDIRTASETRGDRAAHHPGDRRARSLTHRFLPFGARTVFHYYDDGGASMKVVRIACRDNPLAVAQAHMVMQSVREYDPQIVPELVAVKTRADDFAGTPMEELADKETLVSGMNEALEEGKVDLCVHSLTDLPPRDNPKLPIVAVSHRDDARDVMVLPQGRERPDRRLPLGATGARRRAQLLSLYPDWPIEAVRGNVVQRLEKLDRTGGYGALVIPACWLIRLGLARRIFQTFSINQLLPSCGQGIVAVQGRRGELNPYLAAFHSVDSWDCALAERAFLKLQGGVGAPVGANAFIRGDKLSVHGMIVDGSGKMWEGVLSGGREDAEQIGTALAARLQLDAAGPLRRKRTEYDD